VPDASDLVIRTAEPRDSSVIARIFVASWRESYAGLLPSAYLVGLSEARQRLHWLRESAAKGRGRVLVAATGDDGVLGFTGLGPARDKAVGYDGEVYTLYVDPNHTGRGAGRALLQAAFAKLEAMGNRSAVIWALKGNPARFFYEAHGGRLVAERGGLVGGKAVREVAFGWSDIAAPAGRTAAGRAT